MGGAAGESAGRWAVVLALAFGAALGLTALLLEQRGSSEGWTGPSGPPAGLPGGMTARQAYPPAAQAAQAWQADAALTAASAYWQPRQGRWPGHTVWTFQFYSPATARLAVMVVEEGRARLLRETVSPYPLTPFSQTQWQTDSTQALETWWREGGATFLALQARVELTAQLRAPEGRSGPPIWTVTGVAGEQWWTVRVDGMTGERLQE